MKKKKELKQPVLTIKLLAFQKAFQEAKNRPNKPSPIIPTDEQIEKARIMEGA